MKRGAPNHPKVFELAELLGVRRPAAIGYLELLFHFTAQYTPEGNIGKYSDKRIAAALDWHGTPEKLIESFLTSGWVDRDSRVRLVVHGWGDHADRSTLQRLARMGKKPLQADHRDTAEVSTQSETCSYTLPKPEPEPEPEPEPTLAAHAAPKNGASAFADEDGYGQLRKSWDASGGTGWSEPDWAAARYSWRALDPDQRQLAIAGILARAGTDDFVLRAKPENFIRQRMWTRQARAPTPVSSIAERERKRIENL